MSLHEQRHGTENSKVNKGTKAVSSCGGEPHGRQRVAGSKLRAGCLDRVCRGKQYGLYLLGQQGS